MARETLADLGLVDNPRGAAAWLRDNPFLQKTLRAESRRPSLFLRLFFTTLFLGVLLLGGMWLNGAFRRPLALLAGLVGFPAPTLLFITISFVHALIVLGTRGALGTSLATEVRRQTLSMLLMTPLRRAEMLLAMAVGPAAGALLVALAGLPIYLLVIGIGGAEWPDVGLLYLLFALISFGPPAYAAPALSGEAATPETPTLQASVSVRQERGRQQAQAMRPFVSFYYVFIMMSSFGRWFSVLGGGWLSHLVSSTGLPPTLGRIGPMIGPMAVFSWPYLATQILAAPLTFFRGACYPLVYALPLLVGFWVMSALSTAAALGAGSKEEQMTSAQAQRARTLSRWVRRVGLLCLLGLTWQAWVLKGDTGYVLGDPTADFGWSAAGFLLLIGATAIFYAGGMASRVALYGKVPGSVRPLRRWLHRVVIKAWRPLRLGLLFFGLACLFGWLSPFARPVYETVGRLAAVTLAVCAWMAGMGAAFAVVRRGMGETPSAGAQWGLVILYQGLLFGLPVVALSIPSPLAWKLAALSPVTVWLELFPRAVPLIREFPYWPLGQLPPFALSAAAPVLLGTALTAWAFARLRPTVGAAANVPSPAAPAAVTPVIVAQHAARTAALMQWVTARTDNPIVIHEIRSRIRSGVWLNNVIFSGILLLGAIIAARTYPDVVNSVSFLALFHFFGSGPLSVSAVTPQQAYSDLSGFLLSGLVYLGMLAGLATGENLIGRDQQRGILGFLLITPLTIREIFWGKIGGQSSPWGAGWLLVGAMSLTFSLLAAPLVGIGPALLCWLIGQAFALCVYVLCLGLGASFATHTTLRKSLRGISFYLAAIVIGLGVWLVLRAVPLSGLPAGPQWAAMAARLALGGGYCLLLAIPAFAYALWRLTVLRRRDIAFGDSVPN